MATQKIRLGFIGLGIMGTAMVLRLLERGWPVTVWNLEPDRVSTLADAGAVAANSPADVTRASDIIIMCVLNTGAVESCVFGGHGVAQAAQPGKVLLDHSTIDPAATREFARRLQHNSGMGWVDAPVSGGPIAAREGKLTIMAGGASDDINAVRAVVAELAANFTHIGSSGAGQTAKMINQAIVGTNYVLMAEALVMAEAAGIDAEQLPRCLAGGHADSALLQQIYPQMQARAFNPPHSYARQLLKDMTAVKEFAAKLGLDLPVVVAAEHRYATYVAQGNEMKDSASILQLYHSKP